MAVARDLAAYATAVMQHLPSGDAWPREPGTALHRWAEWVGAELARVDLRAADLLREADPRATYEMLAEWEAEYGLPDPCRPLNATIEQRRNALLARITAKGGQSRAYFTDVAAALGYTVTIEEFAPFRFGRGRFGEPMFGDAWAFAWRMRAPETTVVPFRFGRSAFGEPLRSWGNAQLECVLARLKPAHTVLIFAYGSS